LIDLKPERPMDLGPFEAIGLRLKLEGRYAEIDKFLAWIGTDRRLLRVDSIKLDPSRKDQGSKDPSLLSAQILLLSLGTQPEAAAKTKAEVRKPEAAAKTKAEVSERP